jgi:hypothetical protein
VFLSIETVRQSGLKSFQLADQLQAQLVIPGHSTTIVVRFEAKFYNRCTVEEWQYVGTVCLKRYNLLSGPPSFFTNCT